jgi:hypothetical protein
LEHTTSTTALHHHAAVAASHHPTTDLPADRADPTEGTPDPGAEVRNPAVGPRIHLESTSRREKREEEGEEVPVAAILAVG